MKNLRSTLVFSVFIFLTGQAVQAQSIEVVYFERAVEYSQTDTQSVIESSFNPYKWDAGIDQDWSAGGGAFSNLTLSNGGNVNVTLTQDNEDQDEYEAYIDFSTLSALNTAIPSGSYTYSGIGDTLGTFSFSMNVGAFSPLSPKKVTNWGALQSVDTSQGITVELESFTDAGDYGFIEVEIGYFDGQDTHYLWEAPSNRTDPNDPLPALKANTTSVSIPAGTLTGSSNGTYQLWIGYYRIDLKDSPSEFPDTILAEVTGTRVSVEVKAVSNQSWAGYPWANAQGDVDTGSWIDWLNVKKAPYIWSYSLSNWLYVKESSVSSGGAWVYVFK